MYDVTGGARAVGGLTREELLGLCRPVRGAGRGWAGGSSAGPSNERALALCGVKRAAVKRRELTVEGSRMRGARGATLSVRAAAFLQRTGVTLD